MLPVLASAPPFAQNPELAQISIGDGSPRPASLVRVCPAAEGSQSTSSHLPSKSPASNTIKNGAKMPSELSNARLELNILSAPPSSQARSITHVPLPAHQGTRMRPIGPRLSPLSIHSHSSPPDLTPVSKAPHSLGTTPLLPP